MASTDQLRKAERRGARGGISLNSFRSLAYRRALQSAGISIPANATKIWLFKMVVANKIDMTNFRGNYL